jgi:AraC family transcriptional regulator
MVGRTTAAFRFDHGPSDSGTFLRQRLLLRDAARGTTDPLRIEKEVLGILGRLLPTAYRVRDAGSPRPGSSLGPKQRNLVEDAKRFLAERFADRLSLANVAHAVGSSIYHLCRLFRRSTGGTLHQYRSQWRLRRSLDLLASGEQK